MRRKKLKSSDMRGKVKKREKRAIEGKTKCEDKKTRE